MDASPKSRRFANGARSRLLSLADRVEVLTRSTGRAFVDRDATLARALVAQGGEHQRLRSALDEAWSDVLVPGNEHAAKDVPVNANLVHSLQTILSLVGTICEHVMSVTAGTPPLHGTAIEQLAEMVPNLLRDAVSALRRNDPAYAAEVLRSAIAVDACFAQTYLDLLQVVRQDGDHMERAQRLHVVSRALERIGDNASEIAGGVPLPA
ncbi:MAG TPA: PhoU domain-containing protein [Polyangiaceae bacterium]|nr:PhoU domain-containing protein [Polyangiaceae bacterium]